MARPSSMILGKTEIQRICDMHGISPLDYLLSVVNNPNMDVKYKIEAAKAAMPYVHPRLAPAAVEQDRSASQHENLLDDLM